MSEGVENMRYVPLNKPPVNIFIKSLFLLGLVYVLIFERKKLTLWWIVFISVLITQILSDLPPNFSRGLFYIPFIYFICGIFLYKTWVYLKKYLLFKKLQNFLLILLFIGTGALFLYDVNFYFQWMKTDEIYRSRQPAIDYYEFPQWQKYQIRRVLSGAEPVNNYEWYKIRDIINK